MIERLLRCLDGTRRLFVWLDVDYDQLRAILEVKLKVDARRRFGGSSQLEASRPRSVFAMALGFYALLGGFAAGALLRGPSLLVSLTIVHGFVMLFLGMSLITDFSSVILDSTDNRVLLPRAVSGRTILFARTVHVAVYIALIAGSLSLGTMVLGTWLVGWWFAPVFAVTLAASAALCLFGVSSFYLVALRFTRAERFRDLILYFQVGMAVLFLSSYQLLPRLMVSAHGSGASLADRWWVYLLPPAWLAAPADLLAGNYGTPQLMLSTLGLLVPIASVAMVAKVLAPGFGDALLRLEPTPSPSVAVDGAKRSWSQTAAHLACRSGREQAAFELVWRLCARDRTFRLRTYPTLAFVFVLPLLFFSSSQVIMGATFDELRATPAHLFLLYVCCSLVPTAIMHLRISEQHAASWIYAVLPLERPGTVLMAGMKVVLMRLVLPAFLLVSALVLGLWGLPALPDVALAFSVLLLVCSLQALSFERALPFSQPFDVLRSFSRVGKSVLLMALPGVLGIGHLVLTFTEGGVWIAAPVVLGVALLLLRAYAQTDWNQLEVSS